MNFHFKLAFRNLLKQKSSSLINIIGLSISLAVCIFIALYVHYEFSFDKYNKNYNQIYRLLSVNDNARDAKQQIVFYQALKNAIPELQNGCMLHFYKSKDFFSYGDVKYTFENIAFSDANLFNLFSINVVRGSKEDALSGADKAIITESTAKKIFGNENPIGKTINYENEFNYEITAVIEDLPETSHFKADFILPMESLRTTNKNMMESWNVTSTSFYYILSEGINFNLLDKKVASVYDKTKPEGFNSKKFAFQPLSKIHLYSSDIIWDGAIKEDIQTVWSFVVVAILIFFIACFNYINLSIAIAEKRKLYTGIQKTMGAGIKSILKSTCTESFLLSAICIVIAVALVFLFRPFFNSIMGTSIQLSFSDHIFVLSIMGLVALVFLLSSAYLAWYRGRISPIDALSGKSNIFNKVKFNLGHKVSSSVTIAQLAISIILFICVLVIYKQVFLLTEQKLGFNKSQLIYIENPWDKNVKTRFHYMKEQLSSMPEVKGVSATWNVPSQFINNYGDINIVGKNDNQDKILFGQLPVGVDFFSVLESDFLFGRNFKSGVVSDSNKVIINKTGMKMLGLTNPIGQRIHNGFNDNKKDKEYEIIGVIDDIQYVSLKEKARPVIYYLSDYGLNKMVVRLKAGDISQTLKKIEVCWNKAESNYPFGFMFLDKMIQANYKKEMRIRNMLLILASLAIGISILGIFGLTTAMLQNKIKEIGIRKVNGASITEVLSMLNRKFVRWVFIALIIAIPVACFTMNKWLENYAYKTTLNWWIFAIAGMLVLGFTLLTVSSQCWRAATRNPVEALRYE